MEYASRPEQAIASMVNSTTQPILATAFKPVDSASQRNKQLNDLLFGSIAGIVGKFVEYPFDTVKVRLQTQPLENPTYKGPVDCLTRTLKQEGIKGLYRGLSSPLVGSMLENAALFVGYKQIQRTIRDISASPADRAAYAHVADEDDLPPLSIPQLFLAGAISGALTSFVLTPVELVKCKLQVQLATTSAPAYTSSIISSVFPTKQVAHRVPAFALHTASAALAPAHPAPIHFRGPFHVILHTFQTHGLAGFYRGHLATALRETGGGAAWFGMYEIVCLHFINQKQRENPNRLITKKDLSTPQLMLGGALGGMAYNFLLFPVDVIKSHMQTDEELGARRSAAKRGFAQVAKEIYQGAGINGFYRGCGITVARSAPTSAIIFMTYELLSRHFA
ncbi:mitochondrial carrier domain-containing protein [Jimgerdemannia flammicorona]|uniref:Mitochondrial carrier domain-containing protein n=1 Tax=Jimgerdemannia flammicorona TaxID=994334 RepID=A0A433QBL9_9FUNG|nr:mitochondrial carrier domain-containing protein [Jimgerdemannia flammicorona]